MRRLFQEDMDRAVPILVRFGLCGAYFRMTWIMRRLFQEDFDYAAPISGRL